MFLFFFTIYCVFSWSVFGICVYVLMLLLQIPMLVVNAADDPISLVDCVPVAACEANPNIITCITRY